MAHEDERGMVSQRENDRKEEDEQGAGRVRDPGEESRDAVGADGDGGAAAAVGEREGSERGVRQPTIAIDRDVVRDRRAEVARAAQVVRQRGEESAAGAAVLGELLLDVSTYDAHDIVECHKRRVT